MKKFIALLLCIVSLFSFVGCDLISNQNNALATVFSQLDTLSEESDNKESLSLAEYSFNMYKELYGYKGTMEEWLAEMGFDGETETSVELLIQFDTDGGSKINNQKVKKYGKITEPIYEPYKEGYNFDGWYYQDELWNFDRFLVTENMILLAKWSYDGTGNSSSRVYFDANGGYVSTKSMVVEFGKYVSLPYPSNGNGTFLGWYYGDDKITDGYWQYTKDITLTARWKSASAKTYNVSLVEQNTRTLLKTVKVNEGDIPNFGVDVSNLFFGNELDINYYQSQLTNTYNDYEVYLSYSTVPFVYITILDEYGNPITRDTTKRYNFPRRDTVSTIINNFTVEQILNGEASIPRNNSSTYADYSGRARFYRGSTVDINEANLLNLLPTTTKIFRRFEIVNQETNYAYTGIEYTGGVITEDIVIRVKYC